MFGLSLSLVSVVPVLIVAAIGAVVLAYRYWTYTTPISPVHAGKKDTHTLKFDPAIVRRRSLKRPPAIDLSNVPAQDPRVAKVLTAITTGDVEALLRKLSGEVDTVVAGNTVRIVSRSSYGKGLNNAMTMLEEWYDSLGVKNTRINYKWRGKAMQNLEATIPGTSNKVLIIGSHLDSTAGATHKDESKAPGADDDASGTVALMKIAEGVTALIKAGMKLGYTIRLLHFTGEEQGLWGSYTYSDKVTNEGVDLIGMLQMDMIGYHEIKDTRVDLHDDADRNGSHSMVVVLTRASAQYKLNLTPYDTHDHAITDRSDHAGFLDHNHKAVCISEQFTEDEGAFNPNYHSVNDRVSAMNLPYMVEIIRMVLAGAVDFAQIK